MPKKQRRKVYAPYDFKLSRGLQIHPLLAPHKI